MGERWRQRTVVSLVLEQLWKRWLPNASIVPQCFHAVAPKFYFHFVRREIAWGETQDARKYSKCSTQLTLWILETGFQTETWGCISHVKIVTANLGMCWAELCNFAQQETPNWRLTGLLLSESAICLMSLGAEAIRAPAQPEGSWTSSAQCRSDCGIRNASMSTVGFRNVAKAVGQKR